MKKVLLTVLLAIVCQMSWCQTSDEIIENHRNDMYAQYVQMDKEFIKTTLAFMPSINKKMKQSKEVLKKVDLINTILYKKMDKTTKENIENELAQLTTNGYRLLGETNEEDSKGISYVIMEDEIITDLIVFAESKGKFSLMQMKGRITSDQVGTVEKFGTKK